MATQIDHRTDFSGYEYYPIGVTACVQLKQPFCQGGGHHRVGEFIIDHRRMAKIGGAKHFPTTIAEDD